MPDSGEINVGRRERNRDVVDGGDAVFLFVLDVRLSLCVLDSVSIDQRIWGGKIRLSCGSGGDLIEWQLAFAASFFELWVCRTPPRCRVLSLSARKEGSRHLSGWALFGEYRLQSIT